MNAVHFKCQSSDRSEAIAIALCIERPYRQNKPPACHMLTKRADVAFGKDWTKEQKINNGKKSRWINFKLLEKHICSRIFFLKTFSFKIRSFLFDNNFQFLSVTCIYAVEWFMQTVEKNCSHPSMWKKTFFEIWIPSEPQNRKGRGCVSAPWMYVKEKSLHAFLPAFIILRWVDKAEDGKSFRAVLRCVLSVIRVNYSDHIA